MKIQYDIKLRLRGNNISKLDKINTIVEEYKKQGYRLTLRQLYYQLVSRDIISNNLREYAKLSGLLTKGRMAGVVDWDVIEDRLRVPFMPYHCDDIPDSIKDTVDQYCLPRQRNQPVHIEVWVEKDALSGVLRPVTSKYGVYLMVNRGYSSTTAMHDAFRRIAEAIQNDQTAVILYLGDHDPSGIDMIRDIKERVDSFFGRIVPDSVFKVDRIALTQQQIAQYDPPPNPAKLTDPRADWYIKKYGTTCWEVDALTPPVLHKLVEDNVKSLMDLDMYDEVLDDENIDREKLQKLADRIESGEVEV